MAKQWADSGRCRPDLQTEATCSYSIAKFADGSEEKVWCTFDEQQIDLDVTRETTRRFIQENLEQLADHGASIIRLDAFVYANKKIGTNCFFVEPDIWEMLHFPCQLLAPKGVKILPEIHEHYTIQQKKSLSKTTMSMTLPFRCWFFMLFIQVMSNVLFTGWKSASQAIYNLRHAR